MTLWFFYNSFSKIW